MYCVSKQGSVLDLFELNSSSLFRLSDTPTTANATSAASDPKAVAAAARAMLAAKAAATGHPLGPPSSTTASVLSDVAARAAAARAALEKAKRALLMKKEQMAALGGIKVSIIALNLSSIDCISPSRFLVSFIFSFH